MNQRTAIQQLWVIFQERAEEQIDPVNHHGESRKVQERMLAHRYSSGLGGRAIMVQQIGIKAYSAFFDEYILTYEVRYGKNVKSVCCQNGVFGREITQAWRMM
jgi:predicted Fe-Mo cluster-binding NifX family protein